MCLLCLILLYYRNQRHRWGYMPRRLAFCKSSCPHGVECTSWPHRVYVFATLCIAACKCCGTNRLYHRLRGLVYTLLNLMAEASSNLSLYYKPPSWLVVSNNIHVLACGQVVIIHYVVVVIYLNRWLCKCNIPLMVSSVQNKYQLQNIKGKEHVYKYTTRTSKCKSSNINRKQESFLGTRGCSEHAALRG